MATIRRFEDLIAWQRAHALATFIWKTSEAKSWNRDWDLREQIRTASNSVEANIAEGFARRGDKEFRQFLKQAKGSTSEVRSHAYRAERAGYLTSEDLAFIQMLTEECEALIQGLINYLSQSIKASKERK